MRIGLNATCFNDRPSGANRRFFSIYGKVIRQNPEIEFFIYEAADYPAARHFSGAANVIARPTPLPSVGRIERTLRGAAFWPRTLPADRLDLFETFSLPVIIGAPCPVLLTIHDLRPIRREEPLIARLMAKAVLHHGFSAARHVIAVSETVKHEISSIRREVAVSTVYNGIDVGAFSPPDMGCRWAVPQEFLLSVGHIEPRKNFGLLVDAVALLRAQGLARPLVLVGRDGGGMATLRRRIAGQGVGDLVTIIEDADDGAMRALYERCRMVAVPSRYEGFGIPLLEAMAARRALVTSDIPVFRELTEEWGARFPVDDAKAAAVVIERVWSDAGERARLVAHGAERVKSFDIETPARRIGALYRELASASAIRPRADVKEWKRS
ncbi:MAG: glycosyltransferase family 4 protein [Sphingomonas oligoaromativorans]